MNELTEKQWKQLWRNVKTSAKYGPRGGRRAMALAECGSYWDERDLDITLDYLKGLWEKQNGKCYWLDIPMDGECLFVKHSPFAPSVDRLDSSLGYVEGNVVLTSRLANRGRGAYEGDDFKERFNSLIAERDAK